MNCFEWQNRASDYLDGTLIGNVKRAADEHIDTCDECSTHYNHYRLILTAISNQPRSILPIPIRKSPFAGSLPRISTRRTSRSRWERLPWYVKTSIEVAGVVFLIIGSISAGPKIRSLYEKRTERSVNELNEAFSGEAEVSNPSMPAPLLRGNIKATITEGDIKATEDFNYDDSDDSYGERAQAIESAEIWRFNLKTDSPHEVRTRVLSIFKELKISSSTPGIGGIEAPGGIQFDLLLPSNSVSLLKAELKRIAPPAGETFTWFKSKSKQRAPDGKTRVVIWLSQM